MNTKVKDVAYLKSLDTDKDEQVSKAVDWKNPPQLKELQDDLEAAKQATDDQAKKVEEWLDAFHAKGRYAAPEVKGRSRMTVRLVRKQVEWRCPSLTEPFLSSPKLFDIAPRTHEDVAAAEQHELILNYQFKNKINSVKLMDEVVRTIATEGTVIMRTFWDYKADIVMDEEAVYKPVASMDPEFEQYVQELAQQIEQDPSVYESLEEGITLSVDTFMQSGQVLEYRLERVEQVERKKIIRNHPSTHTCAIEDVFPDPSCNGDLDKAKFLVYRFDTCLASLKEEGRYINLDELEKEVVSNEQTTAKPNDSGFKFKDKSRKSLEAYEYWGYYDIDDDGILYSFVATWVGNTLIRLERNPFPDNKIPFVFIPLLPVKGSLYGEPDAELIKENQLIMSATMRGMIDLFARSANGQTGFSKGFLDSTNLERFNSGQNYTFNNGMDPERAIHTHKFNEIPQSAFNLLGYLTNEAESFSGVKSFNNGISGDSLGKTAKGARTALDATAVRDASILRRIAEGLVQVAYKFQTMNSVFLTSEDVVRLTNKEFVKVDKENLSGDFDLSIDISTAEADEAKAADLSFLLQTGQNSFPFEFTKEILAQIAKLKKQPELEHFIRTYEPQPDPMEQKKQELEFAKMDAEIAEIQARTAEMQAKAQVHLAEIGVRGARTENINSNTDKNVVSTFKEANGISQEEKLQAVEAQSNAQSRAQQNAIQTKAQADREKALLDHNNGLLFEGAKNDLEGISQAREAKNNPNSTT